VCIKSHGNNINAGDPSFAQWMDKTDGQEDKGVIVIYSHGDVCGSDKSKRKTIVDLQCHIPGMRVKPSRSVDTSSSPSYISYVAQDGCTTRMTVLTPFACPTNKKFESACNTSTTRKSCFNMNSDENCQCSWCNDKCISLFESCSGEKEFQCDHVIESTISLGPVMVFGVFILLALVSIICCCVGCAIRKKKLRSKLDEKLKLPGKNVHESIAMEPLMGNQQPQWMFVQYPMENGQTNPPFFAPTPYYVPHYPQEQ